MAYEKLDLPLLPETFANFVRLIFAPVEKGQSAQVIFTSGAGSRSLSKFLIKNFASFSSLLKKKAYNYELFFIDPAEMTEGTPLGYLLVIMQQLAPDVDLTDSNTFQVFNKLKRTLEGRVKDKELVFFMHHFDDLPFMNPDLGNNLKALWQVDKPRIHFLFLTYADMTQDGSLESYGRLAEGILENTVKVHPLSPLDVDYVIDRQAKLLEFSLNGKEREAIKHVSQGNPNLLKICCRLISQNPKNTDPVGLLESHYQVQLIKSETRKSAAALRIDKLTGVISQGNKVINLSLSAKQYDLLSQFLLHQNEILTRDQIGEILWGKNSYEKYSDWAIDQMIHELREKLSPTGHKDKLKTIRDKGYSYRSE